MEKIFRKTVDKSALLEEISIPVIFKEPLFDALSFSLKRGEEKEVKVILNGTMYSGVVLRNIKLKSSQTNDMLQLRYSKNSRLAIELRKIFAYTEELTHNFYSLSSNSGKVLKIDEKDQEYIDVYGEHNALYFICHAKDRKLNEIKDMTDEELMYRAKFASILPVKTVMRTEIVKQGDIFVSEYAKRRAKGYCELCKNIAPFIDSDGTPHLEAHHIISLTDGGDDNITNVVALCPNCHKKMHVLNLESDVEILNNIDKEVD